MQPLPPSILSRILRPLVRLMIARGFGFAAASEVLKGLYVEEAERHFRIDGKRMTESRLSLLTGLRRREVKRLRETVRAPDAPLAIGPASRVIARWASAEEWRGDDGAPAPLTLRGEDGLSFERLAADISRDVHPRSILDALEAAGAVSVDRARERVTLTAPAYLPADEEAKLTYLAANLGDHAAAATGNVLSADAPEFLERAAHFNGLTETSIAELNALARRAHADALQQIATAAEAAQRRDKDAAGAAGRFRSGSYIYFEPDERDPREGAE